MLLRDTVVAPSAPMHNSCQQLAAHERMRLPLL